MLRELGDEPTDGLKPAEEGGDIGHGKRAGWDKPSPMVGGLCWNMVSLRDCWLVEDGVRSKTGVVAMPGGGSLW